jgi:arginine decarboxylase
MATRIAESTPAEPQTNWTIESSRALYNIEGWGAGFFDINEKGHASGPRGRSFRHYE